jgi:hypothetical protein
MQQVQMKSLNSKLIVRHMDIITRFVLEIQSRRSCIKMPCCVYLENIITLNCNRF